MADNEQPATSGPMMPFMWGGNSDIQSYEELKRRRAVAAAVAAKQRAFPKTMGEGMTYLGESMGEVMNDRRLRQMEAAQMAGDKRALAGPTAAATPLGGRDRVAAAIQQQSATPEVAQGNPMQTEAQPPSMAAFQAPSEPEPPLGSPSLNPVMNDAAPIGGAGDQLALSRNAPAYAPVAPPTNLTPPVPVGAEENPPTPTTIQPAPRLAQGLPSSMQGLPAPAAFGAPAPAPAPVRDTSQGIPPAPEPMPFPAVGAEPKPPGPSTSMNYWRAVASDPQRSEATRALAAQRYGEEKAAQDQAFSRRYDLWKEGHLKQREYDLGDPARRQSLTAHHLANVKATRELEGEGFIPLTPQELASLPKLPDGQVVFKNRRGELKFGPTPPASTTVNIDQKATGKGMEKIEIEMAEHIVGQFKEGATASDDLRNLTEMRVLAARVNTGPEAVAKSFLGKLGVKTEGISDIEALNATINRIVPQQRVPGTGATSDFDARMFQSAVPHLMNTRDGNMLIMDTLENVARNRIARAEISGKVISRQMTIPEATTELLKLQIEAKGMSDRVKQHLENTGVRMPDPTIPSRATTDDAAREWLKNNPTHPRAEQMRRELETP